MKDVVSNRSICVFTSAVSMSVFWLILIGLPIAGLMLVSLLGLLTLWAALWVGRKSALSVVELIRDVEAEPILAVAPARVAIVVPGASSH